MISEPACLDSSYLVALLDDRDVWHREAMRIHTLLRDRGDRMVSPDCVLNEVLTVLARRCRERKKAAAFTRLADVLQEVVPPDATTWVYPHVPRWFDACVTLMKESHGRMTFHDALLVIAAEELGYRAIVSFDAGFDAVKGLTRLGSVGAVEKWLGTKQAS